MRTNMAYVVSCSKSLVAKTVARAEDAGLPVAVVAVALGTAMSGHKAAAVRDVPEDVIEDHVARDALEDHVAQDVPEEHVAQDAPEEHVAQDALEDHAAQDALEDITDIADAEDNIAIAAIGTGTVSGSNPDLAKNTRECNSALSGVFQFVRTILAYSSW